MQDATSCVEEMSHSMENPLAMEIFQTEKQHDHVGFDVSCGEEKTSIIDNILEEIDGRERVTALLVTSRSVFIYSKTRQILGLFDPCSPNVSSSWTNEKRCEKIFVDDLFTSMRLGCFSSWRNLISLRAVRLIPSDASCRLPILIFFTATSSFVRVSFALYTTAY